MATNPNNAIGTNAAFGGRTSPNAFNDVLGAFQGRGIVSGWECSPDSGMTVVLGGNGTTRDVAIAEDNAGNKTTVDNIPASPISLTIAAAPATQSRIDAVVVYVNNPPQGSSTAVDNYGTVGILDVQGTVASSPVAPDDSDIRTAITTDGASGATAYYVVLAYITVGSGTTTLTSAEIEAGENAVLQNGAIAAGSITGSQIAASAITSSNIDWATIKYSTSEEQPVGIDANGDTVYRKLIDFGALPNNTIKLVASGIVGLKSVVSLTAIATISGGGTYLSLPYCHPSIASYNINIAYTSDSIQIMTGSDRSNYTAVAVLEYTKN